MKRIRILYASSKSDTTGGGQQSLLLLLRTLDKARYEPIVSAPEHGPLAIHVQEIGVAFHAVPVPSPAGMNPIRIAGLIRFLKHHKIDIVHTDGPRNTSFFGLATAILGIPLVWHVRVSTPEPILYELCLYSLSTRIIAVSKAAAGRFRRIPGDRRKVTVIYNAIEIGADPTTNDRKPARDVPVYALIGRIEHFKGPKVFVEACRGFLDRGGAAKFMLVGGGDPAYVDDLTKQINHLSLGETMTLTGHVSPLDSVFDSIDVIVNASILKGRQGGEGLSRALLEAMGRGIPAVATDVGGNGEIVLHEKTGLLVPQEDPTAMAGAMLRLYREPALRRFLGQNARDMVTRSFTSAHQMHLITGCYDELVR